MFALQNLEITRILYKQQGLLLFAKCPEWYYEYNFLVEPNGKVKGKTSQGIWIELSKKGAQLIREKLKGFLEGKSQLYQ
ncbi:MAG: hypothetical protein JW734_02395 [Candidatus Omnitrophica bacterium]|nr:hypothetical protein [Candidatus Omnitrophota bacterium]